MKIAVVLRGQPRSSNEGAKLFRKFIINNVSYEYKFDFFIHTGKFVTRLPLDSNGPSLDYHYNQKLLTHAEVLDSILPWNPKNFYIEDEAPFFNVCKNILNDLANDKHIHIWWDHYKRTNNLSESDLKNSDFIIPELANDFYGQYFSVLYEEPDVRLARFNKEFNFYNHNGKFYDLKSIALLISFHYFLKQYYGFLQSYNVLKSYTVENKSYQPDLIWFTRLDAVHNIVNIDDRYGPIETFFNFQADYLNNSVNHWALTGEESLAGLIGSQRIFIDRNHPWVDDTSFFSNITMMDKIMQKSPTDFVIDAFKLRKHEMLGIINAGITKEHSAWSAIINTAVFTEMRNSFNTLRTAIYREGFQSAIDLESLDSGNESINKFFDFAQTYKRPNNFRSPTPDEIVKEYLKLLNN